MGFSRQKYWSGLPFPSPGDLLDPGIELSSPALPADSLPSEPLLLLLSRFSRVRLCATPQTAAHQAPPSLGFSRQEHWSGLPFLLQCMKVKSESEVAQSCPTLHNLMDCSLSGFLGPWNSPGKNTGVGSLPLLQGIFPTQESNPGLLHCRQR